MISSGKDATWQANQVFTDLNGMNSITQHAGKDRDGAIHAAAKQFESLFVNMMMKQMRESNAVFAKDNFLNSQEMQSRQQMLDQQLAIKLSEGRGVGLADVIYRQMSAVKGATPTGVADGALHAQGIALDAKEEGIALGNHHTINAAALDAALRRVQGASTAVPLHVLPDVADPVAVFADGDAATLSSLASGDVTDDAADLEALIERFRLGAEDLAQRAEAAKQLRAAAPATATAAAGTPEAFIQHAYAAAKRVAEKLGVDVSAVLAQSALESGWGENVVNNNLFGIKADPRWGGERGLQSTLEYRNGVLAREQAWFRSYGDWQQSFEDYGNMIGNNPRYQQALDVGSDPHAYARALQRAGYATDPHYARKISNILNSERFQQALSRMAHSPVALLSADDFPPSSVDKASVDKASADKASADLSPTTDKQQE